MGAPWRVVSVDVAVPHVRHGHIHARYAEKINPSVFTGRKMPVAPSSWPWPVGGWPAGRASSRPTGSLGPGAEGGRRIGIGDGRAVSAMICYASVEEKCRCFPTVVQGPGVGPCAGAGTPGLRESGSPGLGAGSRSRLGTRLRSGWSAGTRRRTARAREQHLIGPVARELLVVARRDERAAPGETIDGTSPRAWVGSWQITQWFPHVRRCSRSPVVFVSKLSTGRCEPPSIGRYERLIVRLSGPETSPRGAATAGCDDDRPWGSDR